MTTGESLFLFGGKPPPRLDKDAGEVGKLHGISNAEHGSGHEWQAAAVDAVRSLAVRHPFLCSDDIWAAGLPDPGEPRALGAAMTSARKLGLVVPTKIFVLTHQATRHRAPVRVWRSSLYPGAAALTFVEEDLPSRRK